MGYYTTFEMEITGEKSEECADAIKEKSGYDWDEMELRDVKWYDYDDDCKAVSKAFPNALICITGHGEENGDEWKHWFLNGTSHKSMAKFVFEKPDWLK